MVNMLLPLHQSIANISFPKQLRLHTTATSLGLPEPSFWQEFHLIGSIFETIQAANTSFKQINFINMPVCTYINGCDAFFPVPVLPLGKLRGCLRCWAKGDAKKDKKYNNVVQKALNLHK